MSSLRSGTGNQDHYPATGQFWRPRRIGRLWLPATCSANDDRDTGLTQAADQTPGRSWSLVSEGRRDGYAWFTMGPTRAFPSRQGCVACRASRRFARAKCEDKADGGNGTGIQPSPPLPARDLGFSVELVAAPTELLPSAMLISASKNPRSKPEDAGPPDQISAPAGGSRDAAGPGWQCQIPCLAPHAAS